MAAYVVIDIDVHDPQRYEAYKRLAPPAVAAFGGRYFARGGRTETLEGGWVASRIVILEFPTLERAGAWWDSSEYAPAKALRQACSRARMIAVEGA